MRIERGFTLIELLVVFAMIALLIGLTPIAFSRMRDSAHYRNTIRTMLTDMRAARSRAVAEGTDVRFKIDLNRRSYGVDGQAMRELPQPIEVRATVANDEMTANNVAAIRFLGGGGATGGSIDVFRSPGNGMRLRVDWLSGKVSQEPLAP